MALLRRVERRVDGILHVRDPAVEEAYVALLRRVDVWRCCAASTSWPPIHVHVGIAMRTRRKMCVFRVRVCTLELNGAAQTSGRYIDILLRFTTAPE